jgi:hypothetical protein
VACPSTEGDALTTVHWLLIGGPADGETVFAHDSSSLEVPTEILGICRYKRFTLAYEGNRYRIGVTGYAEIDADRVFEMIQQKKLTPLTP